MKEITEKVEPYQIIEVYRKFLTLREGYYEWLAENGHPFHTFVHKFDEYKKLVTIETKLQKERTEREEQVLERQNIEPIPLDQEKKGYPKRPLKMYDEPLYIEELKSDNPF